MAPPQRIPFKDEHGTVIHKKVKYRVRVNGKTLLFASAQHLRNYLHDNSDGDAPELSTLFRHMKRTPTKSKYGKLDIERVA